MKGLIVAASVMLCVGNTTLQRLSPAEIRAAIDQGRAGQTLQKKCEASGENGFDFIVEGPIGRIMRAARDAKRDRQAFTAADVTPHMGGPWLTVTVQRDPTLTTNNMAGESTRLPGIWALMPEPSAGDAERARLALGFSDQMDLVLRSKPPRAEEPIVLRPVTHDSYPSGLTSRLYSHRNLTASFDLEAFRAIPHRDVDVVAFMTDAGERRCKISEKDRLKIR